MLKRSIKEKWLGLVSLWRRTDTSWNVGSYYLCKITSHGQEVHRLGIRQDGCLPLNGLRGKYAVLWVCLYKPLQNVTWLTFSRNPEVDLTRVHHPGQYLIKTCFKFGSKIVVVILLWTNRICNTYLCECFPYNVLRKLRFREVKFLVQDDTINMWDDYLIFCDHFLFSFSAHLESTLVQLLCFPHS